MRRRRPRRKSAFRDLHNSFQFWPYYDPTDWYAQDIPEPTLMSVFPRASLPNDHPAEIHLRGANDSGILKITATPEQIKITLNDYDAWRLASRRGENLSLPVDLTFAGIREAFAYSDRGGGKLHRHRSIRSSALGKAYEFNSGHLIDLQEDRIVIVLSFHARPTGTLVLAIDAHELQVTERQREAWIECFGDQDLSIFDRFMEDRKHLSFIEIKDFDNYLASQT